MTLPRQQLFSNRALAKLIIPLIFEQILAVFVGMADSIMVSSVGEAAISGVSLVDNISGVVLNLLAALAAGGGIVTSQLIGACNYDRARRSAGQNITMTVGVSLAISALCLIFSRQIISLFFGHIAQDVMDACLIYMFYQAISFPFLGLYSAGAAILRAGGNTKTAFYVSLLRNAVNICGNALCIYGLKMGVAGVAIPTALSRVVGSIAIMAAVNKSKESLHPTKGDIIHISPKLMTRMFRVGMPTALENSFFQMGRVFTLSMISLHGTTQIAANATAAQLTGFVCTVTVALRTASMTIIGQCVGAHNTEQINTNYKKLMFLSYAFNGVGSIIMVLLRYPLLGLYQSLSPATVNLAAELMCIHLLPSILLYPLSFLITGPLRAANDSVFPMWVSILSMAIFRLSLAQILCVNLGWGAPGVWWAMVADWVCRSVCFTWRWHSGAWKKHCKMID